MIILLCAYQLVLLLRGISLMTDTQFLSRYLTETLLAKLSLEFFWDNFVIFDLS